MLFALKKILQLLTFFHSKKAELNFFAIGENESENTTQAIKLLDIFKYRDNTNLYVFSTQIESEMLLFGGTDQETKIKVSKVDAVRSLVLRNLYENGYDKIFKSAYDDGTDTKKD